MALSRAFAAEDDLRLMQRLAAETTRLLGPLAPFHVGDLTWWMYQHLDKLAEVRIQLWLEEGGCVGWGWVNAKDELDLLVHPSRPELVDAVLQWGGASTVYAAEDDTERIAALERHGYARTDGVVFNHMSRELDEIEEPRVPEGYSLRSVRGDEDLDARVEAHRVVWAPSRVVPASYRRLMREWPYRADLDVVVEAPDGSFAAYVLAWLDEENGVGLFEPVGTHPDHRRRGLGAAACLDALHRLRAAGASRTLVLSVDLSPAEALYERVGFRTVTRHLPFGKKTDSADVRN